MEGEGLTVPRHVDQASRDLAEAIGVTLHAIRKRRYRGQNVVAGRYEHVDKMSDEERRERARERKRVWRKTK